jgi:hypothetical protein
LKLVRSGAIALAVGLVLVAAAAGAARAEDVSPEQQLAEKYAPIVELKTQSKACSTDGEPYRPVPADVVLGRSDVKLVDSKGGLLKTAPTAADLFGRPDDTYLDFPGSPLDPDCTYEQWADQITKGVASTAYAHVVKERRKPGRLAVQYWFYYPFNDWNNKHESDWEMVQLVFDARSASDALERAPVEIGYSQHEGAERADWGDDKLQRQGSHPVVYPGRGSHAGYFKQAIWLGHGAAEGFGCDNTTSPSHAVRPQIVLLPDAPPASADAPFAWLGFEGHWGQKAGGPNTGPTGPNTKTQWTEPISWSQDEWRKSSTEVPLHETLGLSTTSFFCGAVARGSEIYLWFLRRPFVMLGVLGAIVLFGIWLSRRTRWSPVEPYPIDEVRTAGQIYRGAGRIYLRHRWLFLGIGVVFVPLAVISALLQELASRLTSLGSLFQEMHDDPIASGVTALLFGQLSTALASIAVTAAVAHALGRIEEGDHPDALRAYGGIVPRLGSLGWAWFRIILIAGLLTITIVGIPIAVVYLVRKAVTTQACILEDLRASPALARSTELVRRHGLRVLAISALVNVTAYLLGPIVGMLVLLLSSSSLAFVNLVSSLVYAVVVPYAGIAIALLFYDLRRRKAGEEPVPVPRGQVVPTTSH